MVRIATSAGAVAGLAALLLTGSPLAAQVCGDNSVQGDELCDDGNTVGGDGCAANCTTERTVVATLDASTGRLLYNLRFFSLSWNAGGRIGLTYGSPRASDPNGEVPVVVRDGDFTVAGPGFQALCALGVTGGDFGPGNVGGGVIGCSQAGSPQVWYELSRDHNVDDTDPECTSGDREAAPHAGVCNGPPHLTTGQNPPQRGAADIEVEIVQFPSGAGGAGPDGMVCTADDLQAASGLRRRLKLVTGEVSGEILDANNQAGTRIGQGANCGATPCQTTAGGASFDCDALFAPSPDVSGAQLAGVTLALDTGDGDFVLVYDLVLGGAAPTATPTATSPPPSATATPPATGTATPTATPPATPTVTAEPPSPTATPAATGTATSTATPPATPTATAQPPSPTATPPATETAASTATPTVTAETPPPTATPPATETATSTATPPIDATPTAEPANCAGDCNDNGAVSIDELIRGVNILLGQAPIDTCLAFDTSGNNVVTVDELVRGVNAALGGCPG